MGRARACAVAFAVLAVACKQPAPPHPMNGEMRYTCCNMRYEKPEISDVNYQKGTLIPFGTRVQILEVRRNNVKFQPAGHPPITLVLKYGKDAGLTMDQLVERTFVTEDPHAKLARVASKGGKAVKGAKAPADERTRKLIEQGVIEPGMTKDQVLMAKGYPPAHRTPSLDAPMWTYWENRWVTSEVYFDGDKVVRVNR
jgi:hypothetical protein